jgi:hypothetical protein
MVENNDNAYTAKRCKNNKRCRGYIKRKQRRMYAYGRVGERGAKNWEEEREDGKTKSKYKVKNAEGKRLMKWIEENGCEVLNGNKQGDEKGE